MTVMYESSQQRGGWTTSSHSTACLEERYEVIKEVGDGSFGSVSLARVRGAGAHIARRGTMVAVKTMKKTFDSFNHCLELREVIFLKSLPSHPHLVPALDVFLDPYTKKLHIAMEYMDGNLYQLMKARERKHLDGPSVKSILFQIMSGLEHIHAHQFFHRDIKPENILVSTSAPNDASSTFKRYSALVTPPSTPPAYTIKIADFGLARETHSKLPYTTYVSTRWYRAPEVLLRAGEYSAPVDIWAVGAMAVEIATLKPLFPGSNEVDQVWRVCEIMGSPGNWVTKSNVKVGGGEWKDGVKLASKLGFTFPKMAPHNLNEILPQPTWPAALSDFVTWCLMWDPKNRPNASQALAHEYFRDAVDPMRRPKSSSKLLGKKHSNHSNLTIAEANKENAEPTLGLTVKSAKWFRRSLIQREISAPAVTQHAPPVQAVAQPLPLQKAPMDPVPTLKPRPNATKRATWTTSLAGNAPSLVLPSIRPVSPIPDPVSAHAQKLVVRDSASMKLAKNNGVLSGDKMDIDLAASGYGALASPTDNQRESFFSRVSKRARRISARYPLSPTDETHSNPSSSHISNHRNSQVLLPSASAELLTLSQAPRPSWELPPISLDMPLVSTAQQHQESSLKRQHPSSGLAKASVAAKTRKAPSKPSPSPNLLSYDAPDEADELLNEALHTASAAANHYAVSYAEPERTMPGQYMLTPSASANGPAASYGTYESNGKQLEVRYPTQTPLQSTWPTPPYDSSEREENWDAMHNWAMSTLDSVFSTGNLLSATSQL